ncbi:MAG: phosphatidate cytidylyltransferase [Endomicrobium sp.]|jgi:phosphatidate cytidylyltransferase|nr:phosphatidate cytidylyltransferase [Endomicrobium sp.]
MLLTRILTAMVGIPIIFACVYLGNVVFCAMIFIISFLCVREYLIILKKYDLHIFISLVVMVLFFLLLCFLKNISINEVAFSACIIAFIFFAIEFFYKTTSMCIARIAVSFLGSFFIPLALMHMVYIRSLDNGMELMFFLFFVVWVLDTAAYGFGVVFGRHGLAKNISPKKTIEGAIAGIVFGMFAALACRYMFMRSILTSYEALIFGFIIAVTGQFSDLAESLIKRDGSIKDSGKILPGHGGVFDRFDSYVFAAPALYYTLKILQ